MQVSTHVLEASGFREFEKDESVSAAFYRIDVLSIRGIVLEPGESIRTECTLGPHTYAIAASTSVNDGARALVQSSHDFTEDEAAWAKEHKCSPPYLLILSGPTEKYTAASGHVRIEDDGTIHTYDSFAEPRLELRRVSAAILPSAIASLTAKLSSPQHPVRLLDVTATSFGLTDAGAVVLDTYYTMHAEGHTSERKTTAEVREVVQAASTLASGMDVKVARFLYLGLREKDATKRFLYLFLSIEILTHATFRRIDHTAALTRLIAVDERIQESQRQLFREHQESLKNLKSRFVWCCSCTWQHLTDNDIDSFRELKRVRDDIAHGTQTDAPAWAVIGVEKLALLLHADPTQ